MNHPDNTHSGHATGAPVNDGNAMATHDRIPRDDNTHGKDNTHGTHTTHGAHAGAHDTGKHAAAAAVGVTQPAGYERAPQYDGDVKKGGGQELGQVADTQTFIANNALGGAAPPAAPVAQELHGEHAFGKDGHHVHQGHHGLEKDQPHSANATADQGQHPTNKGDHH
jgi:hypothetical protein